MKLELAQNVSLVRLRRDHPDWTWSAERSGMGWSYRGRLGGREAVVRAYAHLTDDRDDSHETVWTVEEGRNRTPYGSWTGRPTGSPA